MESPGDKSESWKVTLLGLAPKSCDLGEALVFTVMESVSCVITGVPRLWFLLWSCEFGVGTEVLSQALESWQ